MTENKTWENLGLTDFPQHVGFWKGRVWHCRQWAHHIKWCFLTASGWTGENLGGLAVDIGMFSCDFLFWGVWKVSLSSNIRCLRLNWFFLGVLHNPNSKIYRSIRYKNHVHLSLKQGTKNAVIFMQATEKALTIFNIIDCCSDIFLQKISMTHTNRFLISQHGLITLNGLKTTLPLF